MFPWRDSACQARGSALTHDGGPSLEVLRETIQPFPTFSEIFVDALRALRAQIAAGPQLMRVESR